MRDCRVLSIVNDHALLIASSLAAMHWPPCRRANSVVSQYNATSVTVIDDGIDIRQALDYGRISRHFAKSKPQVAGTVRR